MDAHSFLLDALILLAAAVVAVPLFRRLGLGSVLGYLVAGAVLGPWGLRVVQDADSVRRFSEIGVVLFMFIIGLEVLPKRLWEMRRQVVGFGGAQVVATGLLLAGGAALLGLSGPSALVAGFALALSSTAFAVQALVERNQLATRHGRAAFAILLFQDIAVIPMMALLPLLGTGSALGGHGPSGLAAAARGAVVLFVVIAAGRTVLRPVFRAVARAQSQEAFTATALAVVVGGALLLEAVGLSMAFGAFLAGVLLADSEYRHELEADIEPFKGLLLGLFFMSVGMSVNLGLLHGDPAVVCGLSVAVVAVKVAVAYAITRAARVPPGGAAILAASISQSGEFAFVLFGLATGLGVLTREVADTLVLVVTLSMAMTPLALALTDRIQRWRSSDSTPRDAALPPEENGVIIAGFGRFGQIVGRVLAVRRIGFTALDRDPQHIEFVRQYGSKVYFGDVTRLDLLRAAKADQARVLVLAIDDVEASVKAAALIKQHFPNLTILARARNRLHAYRLLDLGIEVVNRETFLSSIEVGREALIALGLPDSVAAETVRTFREHDEKMVRKAAAHHQDAAKLIEIAREGRRELQSLFDQDVR